MIGRARAVVALAAATLMAGCSLLAPSREELVGGGGAPAVSCEEPWFPNPAIGHCYATFEAPPAAWSDARDACVDLGATLAIITSTSEVELVTTSIDIQEPVWIGGYDTTTGGGGSEAFAWKDSMEPWWPNWAAGEPEGSEGALGDCVVLDGSLFEDIGCGALRPYLCERPSP